MRVRCAEGVCSGNQKYAKFGRLGFSFHVTNMFSRLREESGSCPSGDFGRKSTHLASEAAPHQQAGHALMELAQKLAALLCVAVGLLVPGAHSYAPVVRPAAARVPVARGAGVTMATVSTNAKNLGDKQAIVDEVKGRLEGSSLIFTFRADGIEVNQLRTLRDAMPEGCSVKLVKNRLLKRAIEGDPKWDNLDELLHYSNYWAFVTEDQMKPAIDAVQKFLKDTGRLDKDHPLGKEKGVRGGIFEGEPLDVDGIVKVSKLPTKIELIQKIAIGINMVPTRLARSIDQAADATPIARGIKQVPTKVGRAVKLAKAEE